MSNLKCQILGRKKNGFTLIELLVVFTIITVVSTVSVASFVSYSRGAVIQQTANDIAALLRDAKSRTQSQVKPASCSGSLAGYQVDICGLTGSSCVAANTYTLSLRCSSGTTLLVTKSLPTNVAFTNSGTTSVRYFFEVLTNGVTGAGNVALSGVNSTRIITVGQSGSISIQ